MLGSPFLESLVVPVCLSERFTTLVFVVGRNMLFQTVFENIFTVIFAGCMYTRLPKT